MAVQVATIRIAQAHHFRFSFTVRFRFFLPTFLCAAAIRLKSSAASDHKWRPSTASPPFCSPVSTQRAATAGPRCRESLQSNSLTIAARGRAPQWAGTDLELGVERLCTVQEQVLCESLNFKILLFVLATSETATVNRIRRHNNLLLFRT